MSKYMTVKIALYDLDEHRAVPATHVRILGNGTIQWKNSLIGWQNVPEGGYIEVREIKIRLEDDDRKNHT